MNSHTLFNGRVLLGVALLLAISQLCHHQNQVVASEHERSSGRLMIGAGADRSGARSVYQLAPFGEGFGFADLFKLFSRDSSSKRQLDQLSEDLIQRTIDDDRRYPDHDETPADGKEGSGRRLPKLKSPRQLALKLWPKKASSGSGSNQADLNLDSNQTRQSSSAAAAAAAVGSPVILVPGYGGSRLEARLDKPHSVHYICDTKSDWTDMWINVKQLLPYVIDCLIDNMRLEFDPATNRTRNTPGVEVRVRDANNISSVEYLNNMHISGFAYFAPIIGQLTEGKLGYEREINLLGAPYDFRKAPNELADYFERLKESTERQALANGNKAVSYICHSMGCNNMLYFLQRQSDAWKAKYVRRLISIAAPWGGSVSAMRAAAIGDDLGMPYLFSESKLLLVQRSLPSTIFLFPNKQAFGDSPLIETNVELHQQQHHLTHASPVAAAAEQTNNQEASAQEFAKGEKAIYTAKDFKKFFEDVNHPDGYRMWLNTKDMLGSLEAPGVEVWCLVGHGKQTLGRLEYAGQFPSSPSEELYDDGDGTVTIQSANYCKRWAQEQAQPVYYRQFEADHLNILKEAEVVKYVEEILDTESASEREFNAQSID